MLRALAYALIASSDYFNALKVIPIKKNACD